MLLLYHNAEFGKKGLMVMIYAVSMVTAVLLTVFFYIYMKKTGYFLLSDKIEISVGNAAEDEKKDAVKNNDNENDPEGENADVKNDKAGAVYSVKQSFIFTGLFFIMAVITNFFIYKYSYEMNEFNRTAQPLIFLKMAIVHAICACAALTDYKRCRIPNTLIVTGLASRVIIYIAELFIAVEYFKDIIINDMAGFAIGFAMLFVIAVITKGSIGFGDVKLFGVIGLMAGSGGVFALLVLSLFFSSIASVILILMRKKTLSSSVPMAPFIYIGFAAAVILGIF